MSQHHEIVPEDIPKGSRRHEKRGRRSLFRVVLTLFFLLAAFAAMTFGAWNLLTERGHTYRFFAGSKIFYHGDRVFDLEVPALLRHGSIMVPANALEAMEGLTVSWQSETKSVVLEKEDLRLIFPIDQKRMIVNGETMETDHAAFLQDQHAYIPVAAVFANLGYAAEYTDSAMGLNFFSAAEKNLPPVAAFHLDKDVYAQGEKVWFQLDCYDPDGDGIVDFSWEGMSPRYFSNGDHTVILKVKDGRGAWSEPFQMMVKIDGPAYQGADKVPVLMYHAFGTAEECAAGGKYNGNGAILSIDKFRDQMKWLSDQGYHAVFTSELLEYLSAGVLPPQKSVVITFDDGYRDNYTDAYPILREYGLKGNIAPVMMGSVRATDGLNETQVKYPRVTFPELREMMDSGVFEVGSHSYDGHGSFPIGDRTGYFFINPKIKPRTDAYESDEEFFARIGDDLILSKRVLAERLDITDPPYFVYPFGRYTRELEQEINRLGFSSAYVIGNRYVTAASDRYLLPRFTVSQEIEMKEFIEIMQGIGGAP